LVIGIKQQRFDHAALTRRGVRAIELIRDSMEKAGISIPTAEHPVLLENWVASRLLAEYWRTNLATAKIKKGVDLEKLGVP
jgi:hypothetical protein